MKYSVVLEYQLSGAEVPPEIRVADVAAGHEKQAENENNYKDTACLQQSEHSVAVQGSIGLAGHFTKARDDFF